MPSSIISLLAAEVEAEAAAARAAAQDRVRAKVALAKARAALAKAKEVIPLEAILPVAAMIMAARLLVVEIHPVAVTHLEAATVATTSSTIEQFRS